ncbi:hypothetical protein Pint_12833 [Pistacia integerrima]|uniref:Uncharacterized protein n=1 Tax=Pistacia integerrima TaxID=434235 RepID=A0ACC0Y7T0_9ROSI|nr:hypothetical protein Pint_12833 [Pistacia integerrima]
MMWRLMMQSAMEVSVIAVVKVLAPFRARFVLI